MHKRRVQKRGLRQGRLIKMQNLRSDKRDSRRNQGIMGARVANID